MSTKTLVKNLISRKGGNMGNKSVFTKTIISSKTFNYSNKGVNLNFGLRVDNSSELKSFKRCLEEAIRDIDEFLKGMKN